MPDRLQALPTPQRNALSVALGLVAGDVPDRFLVGLAVLSLLAAVGAERALLSLVEDAQWPEGRSSVSSRTRSGSIPRRPRSSGWSPDECGPSRSRSWSPSASRPPSTT